MHTQKLIIATLTLVIGLGFGAALTSFITVETDYGSDSQYLNTKTVDTPLGEFKEALLLLLDGAEPQNQNVAMEPQKLMTVLPNVIPADFDNVEAVVGRYQFINGVLSYTNSESIDEAANDITDAGLATFRDNVYHRLGYTVAETPTHEVVKILQEIATSTAPVEVPASEPGVNPNNPIACTMDAKMCPDGVTYVGRVAPHCEFAACPVEAPKPTTPVVCTAEQKKAEACIELYAPVCGDVQVECVAAPCNPVKQTFSNSCFACAEDRVISYTEGSCVEPVTAY